MSRKHSIFLEFGILPYLLFFSAGLVHAFEISFNQNLTTQEEVPLEVELNAFDSEGGTLNYSILDYPSNGALTPITAGDFSLLRYTPTDDFNGTDFFSWRATDAADPDSFTDANVTITVTQVNDAPVITSNGGSEVVSLILPENSIGSVLTVMATDVDGDSIVYSFSGGSDFQDFNINAVTGEVTFLSPPDFENPTDADGENTYSFVLMASDGSMSDSQNVTVEVSEAPDPPIMTGGAAASVTIDEGETFVIDVNATDQDGDSLTYSKSGPDADLFSIDSLSGVLAFRSPPDYEVALDTGDTVGDNTYVVYVTASDGVETTDDADQTIKVTVSNLNDTSPEFTSSASASAPENQTAVFTVEATDADGQTPPPTFALAGGADESKFFIDEATGVLTFNSAPNYEAYASAAGDNTYVVDVHATDGINTSLETITVTVINVNDETPLITSGPTANPAENQTAVITVEATDGDGDDLTFSITGGSDESMFIIDRDSGVLTFNPAPDYEQPLDSDANNVYEVEVTASDDDNATADASQTITVTVDNLNDNPPAFTSSHIVSRPENQTAVIDVNASDGDEDEITFTITGGSDQSKFLIDIESGVLTFRNPPNFDVPGSAASTNVYVVEVTANDGSNNVAQTISVTVTDVSDIPPVIVQGAGPLVVTMDEDGSPTPWVPPTLGATDLDAGDILTWSVKTQASNGVATVSGASPSPSAPSTFTYVPNADYNGVDSFVVQVSDGGTSPIAIMVNVSVDSVADSPVITSLDGNETSSISIVENQTMVVDVSSYNPDGISLTYSLAGTGTDEGNFTINSLSGLLTFKNPPDFENPSDSNTDNDYVVGVSVSDGNSSDTQTITVRVTDANEAPEVDLGVVMLTPVISEDGSPDPFSTWVSIPGFSPTATDPDANDTEILTWSVSSNPSHGTATVTGTGASLSAFDYVPDGNYSGADSFVVRVSDGKSGTDAIAVHVTITSQPDAPVITSLDGNASSSISIVENQTAVVTVAANDADGDEITFSKSGADQASFVLDVNSGVLTFNPAPDFENPTDTAANGTNTYEVIVAASDGDVSTSDDTQIINVTVTDFNERPVIAEAPGPLTVTMSEDDNGTWVAPTLTATDDDGDVLTWSVATNPTNGTAVVSGSGPSPTTFTYGPDGNFSGNDSFVVSVNDGLLQELITVSVTVNSVSDSPIFTVFDGNATATVTVPENFTGTVTSLAGFDGDGDDLKFIADNADPLQVDLDSGIVTFPNAPPDFENPADSNGDNDYVVTFTVTDDFVSPDGELTLTVTVTDVNEAPVITSDGGLSSASIDVDENHIAVTTVIAADEDAGSSETFSITGGVDQALFDLNSTTGVLTFIDAPDYETPNDSGANNSYEVDVTVTEVGAEGLTAVQTIIVNLLNLNDNSPIITSNGGGLTVDLNVTENELVVADLEAGDLDVGDDLTYAITGGADQALFEVDASTGILNFSAAPDFESPIDSGSDNTYEVQVTVADNADGNRTDAQTFIVSVQDENEAPEITSLDGNETSTVVLNENLTAVTTFTATDQDAGDTLTYSLSGTDQALFEVDASTGALTFTSAPDFETPTDVGAGNTYIVIVTATDDGDGSRTDSQTLTVVVENENEVPVITSDGGLSAVNLEISENLTDVTTVVATDVDDPSIFAYSISGGADQAKFAIDTDSGELTFVDSPDYEDPTDSGADNSYEVEVTVTDDGAGLLSDHQMIMVNVQDANEAPVITSDGGLSAANLEVWEGFTAVTTVIATDVDNPSIFAYSISGGADQAKFAIDTDTGELTFVDSPDYEDPTDSGADNSYEVQVTVDDDGVPAESDAQFITVSIKNDNDNDPEITSSGGVIEADVTVDEDQYAVLDVNATDADGDDVTYSISGGADRTSFQIDANSGQLDFNKTLPPPDFETIGGQVFVVEVNASDGTRWDRQEISVTLRDLNDPPVPNQFSSNNEETTSSGSVASAILGGAVEYRKETDPEHGTLTWSANNDGSWSYDPNPNYFGQDKFKFRVYDPSQSDPFSPAITVFLNVVNVNDVPVITQGVGPLSVSMSEDGDSTPWSSPELSATDADPGDALTWSIESNASNGVASFADDANASSLVYDPNPNYNGSDSFVVLVSDGESNDTITIRVNISAVDDYPVFGQVGPLIATAMTEDNASTWVAPDLNASDVDSTPSSLTWSLVTNASNGTAIVSGSGLEPTEFSYAPDADFNGTDSFVVQVSDGVHESTIMVQVPVLNVNDAPVVTNWDSNATASISVKENETSVADLNATDFDPADVLTWRVSGGADEGNFTIETGTGVLSFATAPNFEANGSAAGNNTYVVEVTVADNTDGNLTDVQTITVEVTDVNEPPSVSSWQGNELVSLEMPENLSEVAELNATDEDIGDHFVWSVAGEDGGLFQVNGNSLTFVSAPDFEKPADADEDNFYRVEVRVADDGNATSPDPQTIIVEVTDANDAPVLADPGLLSHPENELVLIDLNATDADGGERRPDVLFASDNNLIGWFSNKGNGSFGNTLNPISVKTGEHYALVAGDLDNDGDLDVVSVARANNTINVYENEGAGIFGSSDPILSGVTDPVSVLLRDLDGDENLDLVVASFSDGKVIWFKNNGVGTFSQEMIVSQDAFGASSLSVGDMDGDGDQDILAALGKEDLVVWYENNGSESNWNEVVVSDDVDNPKSVFAGDLDGDGDLDVLSASYNDDTIAWFANAGDGTFGPLITITTMADGAYAVHAADLDGDGDLDVLSGSSRNNMVLWFVNDDSVAFSSPKVISSDSNGVRSVTTSDLDGDGDLDVLSASQDDGVIAWHENLGGSFGFRQVITTDALGANSVIAADVDWNADQLKYSIMEGNETFQIDEDTGILSFINAPDYENPTDRDGINEYSVTVKVSDGNESSTLTIDLEVIPVNEAPVIEQGTSITVDIPEDNNASEWSSVSSLPIASDYERDIISWTLYEQASNGIAVVSGAGPSPTVFSYVANSDYNGSDSFVVKVTDGVSSDLLTVYVNVTAVNDPPVIVEGDGPVEFSMQEDDNSSFVPLSLSATDVDSVNALNWSVESNASNGVAVVSGTGTSPSVFSYVPNPDFDGSDSFTVSVSDGEHNDTIRIQVLVNNVNDPPIISQGAGPILVSMMEDDAGSWVSPDLNATDGDHSGGELSWGVDTAAANGVVTASGSGSSPSNLSYAPIGDFVGPDRFVIKVTDPEGAFAVIPIDVTVTNVNDGPIAKNLSLSLLEDQNLSITLQATDPEGDLVSSFYVVTNPAHGDLSLLNEVATYSPDPNFAGPDSFTFQAADSETNGTVATVTLNVIAVNDAPVGTDLSLTLVEDGNLTIALEGTDQEGSPLSYYLAANPGNGTVDLVAGNATYVPNPNYFGPDSFTYLVSDGDLNSTAVKVDLNVTAVNDVPMTMDLNVTVAEDGNVNFALLGATVDGDSLTYQVVGTPSHGSVTLAEGNATYVPAANYVGPDSFTYLTGDGELNSTASTVYLTVTSENDPPTAGNDAFSVVDNGSSYELDVLANDNLLPDLDGNETLSVVGVSSAGQGNVTMIGGSLIYRPKSGFVGTDSFTYELSDGSQLNATGTVNIIVTSSTSDAVRGWNQLPSFGPYYDLERPWVYHMTLGWVYVPVVNGEKTATWMWSEELGWFWTGETVFPYLFMRELNTWVYLDRIASEDKWRLYDYSQTKWISSAEVLRERLTALLNGSPNPADTVRRLQSFPALPQNVIDEIVLELTYFGSSTVLSSMNVPLGY